MKTTVLFWGFICWTIQVFAQAPQVEIYGTIFDENQKPVPQVYLYLEGTSTYTISDFEGNYRLKTISGENELAISYLGYADQSHKFQLNPGEKRRLDIHLKPDEDMKLDEIYLDVKSRLQKVRETSFNVVALNTEELHNSNLDISESLEKVSGVKVRRTGGTGSDYNVMLNGFTGKHVKFFIDGVPMEGFNSSFQLNNIPVNLAKRIEVYKGVVPISFGADALGGAINIVTSDGGKQNFVDVSYTAASFNTHKSFLNAAYTGDSGFTARLTAYQNYSDNNYKVDADIVNLETHQFTGDIRRVRRFHDMYRNYSIGGKLGFVNKKWADEILVGLSFADEYDEIQHPAYMKLAFGQKYMASNSLNTSFSYRKRDVLFDHLDFNLSALLNTGDSKNIDDSYRRYNWLGEYIVVDAPGEFNYTRNYFENKNGSINANLTYLIAYKHRLTFNNVLNSFWRKSEDRAEPKAEDKYPTETLKNISAFAYQFQPDDKLSLSAFGKHYYNQVKQYADINATGDYEHLSKSTTDLGYGLTGSYFISNQFQVKSSYEKSYRLPSARELFGAGNDFDLGNPDLKSESSDNFNFGVSLSQKLAKNHQLNIDASFIYRDIRDFIRMVPNPSNGVLRPGNEALVKNRGLDFGMVYTYKKLFSWETSLTYQDMRNKLKYREGKDVPSTIYNDRIPNMPYFYGNTGINFNFKDVFDKKDQLNVGYEIMYIHEFDYAYESYGGIKIPTQISHDVSLSYSFGEGRYNVSFSARNLLDKNLYDNYSLQKPGRNFSVKFRYFLNQFK